MSLLDSMRIGETALDAHSKRLEIHAKNIANIDTPNYKRQIPLLRAKDDISFEGVLENAKNDAFRVNNLSLGANGVNFAGVVQDNTESETVHMPNHPDADENGNVKRSNVNPMIDMADSIMTSRTYEANLALITVTKSMAQRALELGKG